MEVGLKEVVFRRIRVLEDSKVNPRPHGMRLASHENYAGGIHGGGRCEKLRGQEFREQERSEMIGGHLVLELFHSQFERSRGRGGVVDEDLIDVIIREASRCPTRVSYVRVAVQCTRSPPRRPYERP